MPAEALERRQHGVHPVIAMLAIAIGFWFMAALSLTFGLDGETNYLIAVEVVFTLAFGSLLIFTGSITSFDPRWQLERLNFSRFLGCRAEIATGSIRGRAAMIQILALPVSLAVGMTAIGLIWLLIQ
jgi:hypothetical protein